MQPLPFRQRPNGAQAPAAGIAVCKYPKPAFLHRTYADVRRGHRNGTAAKGLHMAGLCGRLYGLRRRHCRRTAFGRARKRHDPFGADGFLRATQPCCRGKPRALLALAQLHHRRGRFAARHGHNHGPRADAHGKREPEMVCHARDAQGLRRLAGGTCCALRDDVFLELNNEFSKQVYE